MMIALDSNGKPAKLRAVFRKHQGSPFLAGKFLNFQDEQAFDHETMRFYVVGMTPDGKMGTSEPIGFFRVLHEKHQSRDPGGGIWNTVLGGLAGARLDPIGVIAGAIIGSNQ